MKKDALSAVIVILLIFAFTFGVAAKRTLPEMQPTHPFTETESVAGPAAATADETPAGHVVLRVNGEGVTEEEFSAAYQLLPPEMQQQVNTGPGKQAFAEQMVRVKVLEQEARRLNLQKDPNVAGQLAAQRSEILAGAAAQKMGDVSPAAVQKFYDANKEKMQTVELSHIVVAYQGGMIPPKGGGQPLDQRAAMNKALQIYQQLQEGAKFEDLARKESDDTASAERGGLLGPVAPGMLPPELDARVMNLKPGEISTAIPSRYGIHIFKAGARQTQPLTAVQDRIAQRVKQEETVRRVEELRKTAKVEFDPQFFPDANKPPAAPPRPPGTTRPPA